MEREHILKEIQQLAERIKTNTSDADLLLKDVTRLYEISILLKHLPKDIKANSIVTESMPIQKEEIKAQAVKNPVEEKPQSAMDLFSAEAAPIPPTPEAKKETPKPLGQKKISDLKGSIGINEKFQFINELFDGNMKEYNVALDQINNFSSFGEAYKYLSGLKDVYKWNPENPIASNFEELVQRRFF